MSRRSDKKKRKAGLLKAKQIRESSGGKRVNVKGYSVKPHTRKAPSK